MPRQMTVENVHWFLDLFTSLEIVVWIDGGWGVDALLGEQSRPHGDLDIIIPTSDSTKLTDALLDREFSQVYTDDRTDRNFVMGHPGYGLIDFHVIELTEGGMGIYDPWVIPASDMRAEGSIGGRTVRCLSPEYQVRSHSGYTLKSTDFADMAALHEKLGVTLLAEQVRRNA